MCAYAHKALGQPSSSWDGGGAGSRLHCPTLSGRRTLPSNNSASRTNASASSSSPAADDASQGPASRRQGSPLL
jgi:hypothetical protein